MPEIELSAGPVAYDDTGGDGPVVVLLHGLVHDNTVWHKVTADLRTDHRVIAPTLPYGAHRRPMTVPLSPDVVNDLVAEFLERLDLWDVTLAESDCGRAQTVAVRHPERLARLVLISCEAFDNYPPGLPGKMLSMACRTPLPSAECTKSTWACGTRRLTETATVRRPSESRKAGSAKEPSRITASQRWLSSASTAFSSLRPEVAPDNRTS